MGEGRKGEGMGKAEGAGMGEGEGGGKDIGEIKCEGKDKGKGKGEEGMDTWTQSVDGSRTEHSRLRERESKIREQRE